MVKTKGWGNDSVSFLPLFILGSLGTVRTAAVIMSLWAVLTVSLISLCFFKAWNLSRYIAEAKVTGLPYVILPFHPFSASWALLRPVAVLFLCRCPARLTERWLP